MAVIELSKLKKHNMEEAAKGNGLESAIDVRDTVEKTLPEMCNSLQKVRKGFAEDKKGNKLPPRDVSFQQALQRTFGFKDVSHFLQAFDLFKDTHSLADVARTFGLDNLSKDRMENMLTDHSSFSTPYNTNEIDSSFRFIIPEIFTSAIRTGYQHASMHQNWIASTINMPQQKITMPMIKRGDGMPSKVNEGANIPVGSLQFARKDVTIFKIGTGFRITDELVMASQLDMLYLFLQEVGNDMAIGADSQAMSILVNGEQADGSESAPLVGVLNTSNGFTYQDIKKVFTRMTRLAIPAKRMITGEDDGISITGIDRFEGFQGQTRLSSIRSIIGVPEQFEMDTYVLPANQIMYLNPDRAMVKLQYRGMMTEKLRNPQNQTENLFISDWINYAIVKREARVLQTKATVIGSQPFPSYMDIDSRINQSYQAL